MTAVSVQEVDICECVYNVRGQEGQLQRSEQEGRVLEEDIVRDKSVHQ